MQTIGNCYGKGSNSFSNEPPNILLIGQDENKHSGVQILSREREKAWLKKQHVEWGKGEDPSYKELWRPTGLAAPQWSHCRWQTTGVQEPCGTRLLTEDWGTISKSDVLPPSGGLAGDVPACPVLSHPVRRPPCAAFSLRLHTPNGNHVTEPRWNFWEFIYRAVGNTGFWACSLKKSHKYSTLFLGFCLIF